MRRAVTIRGTTWVLLSTILLLTPACDKVTLPRLGYEKPPEAVAPLTVRVVLDPTLQEAILSQSVCDNQRWEGRVGPVLVQKIEEAGRARIQRTIVASERADPLQKTPPVADYQVQLRLIRQELIGKDKTGSTDQFQARLAIELAATYQAVAPDGTARTLGEGPLRYLDNVSIFTPRVGQAGGRCLTNSLDDALTKAADRLADQLFAVVVQLPTGGPSAGTSVAQAPPSPSAASEAVSAVATGSAVGDQGSARRPSRALAPSPTTPAQESTGSRSRTAPDDPTYAVVIGIRSYRDPWPTQGPSSEIDQVIHTLRDQVGMSLDHLMVLEDELANRLDIEEAITQWLASRANGRAVVYVYFLGQAVIEAHSGEIHLAPYDASPDAPLSRFVSLRRLQTQLTRINAKVTLAFIDAPLTSLATRPAGKDRRTLPPPPNWRGMLTSTSNGRGIILQFARNGEDHNRTNHLLAGLSGAADADRDGQVTAGELLRSLKGITATAPLVSASSPALNTVLSRPVP